jgi:hypothetical protein
MEIKETEMNKAIVPIAGLLLISASALAQPPSNGPAPDSGTPGVAPAPEPPPGPAVDVFALIERLSREMSREFILDPRMRGIFGGTTAGDDADYETLLGILRVNGWMAVETDEQILIVPDTEMRTQPSRLLQEDDRRVSDHEIVTRVIDVSDLALGSAGAENGVPVPSSAAMLVPILRPMLPVSAKLGTTRSEQARHRRPLRQRPPDHGHHRGTGPLI